MGLKLPEPCRPMPKPPAPLKSMALPDEPEKLANLVRGWNGSSVEPFPWRGLKLPLPNGSAGRYWLWTVSCPKAAGAAPKPEIGNAGEAPEPAAVGTVGAGDADDGAAGAVAPGFADGAEVCACRRTIDAAQTRSEIRSGRLLRATLPAFTHPMGVGRSAGPVRHGAN